MSNYEIAEGSRGLRTDEVAHVFIPGRGRNPRGNGLTESGIARTDCGADFYEDHDLSSRHGVIITSGYKTPAENNGDPWHPPDEPTESFVGIPEGELMRLQLLMRGIGAEAIRAERHSIDTVTNFTFAEAGGYFPDRRPVAIVAQEEHLDRMLKIIAPRTLRRDYLGVIVPETGPKELDSIIARIFSRVVLVGVTPKTENAADITKKRVQRLWRIRGVITPVPRP